MQKLKKTLSQNLLHFQAFYLCYNTKQMQQYGHFKRQRGIANSRSHEQLFLCYPGRQPKHLAKARAYVDEGTTLFNQVMRNVPVLPQRHHALVSKAVRETSLMNMMGRDVVEVEKDEEAAPPDPPAPAEEEGAEAETAAPAPEKALVTAAIKKRRLYRQLSGTEVPWFPHDNDIELVKELCHEAGRPRWVYFGTPAGGAGMHGVLEMGASVLALCFDAHHKEHLSKFLTERAVEAMLGNSTIVFSNETLLARSVQLHLTAPAKAEKKEEKKEEKGDNKKAKKEKGEEDGEDKKGQKKKKKKTQKKTEKSSDSDSDDNSDSEPDPAPPKKVPKKQKA